jgi:hypothetical protein
MENPPVVDQSVTELVIVDQGSYDLATEVLKDIKARKKKVEEVLDPQCKAAHAAWKTATEKKKEFLKPLEDAEKALKGKVSDYLLEVERKQKEAQRRADEEAEQKRQEAIAAAAECEDEEEAELLLEEAAAPAPVIAAAAPKSSSISTTSDYDIDVEDMSKFVAWLMTERVDISTILSVKKSGIKQYCKMIGATSIPGCRLTPKKTIGVR